MEIKANIKKLDDCQTEEQRAVIEAEIEQHRSKLTAMAKEDQTQKAKFVEEKKQQQQAHYQQKKNFHNNAPLQHQQQQQQQLSKPVELILYDIGAKLKQFKFLIATLRVLISLS